MPLKLASHVASQNAEKVTDWQMRVIGSLSNLQDPILIYHPILHVYLIIYLQRRLTSPIPSYTYTSSSTYNVASPHLAFTFNPAQQQTASSNLQQQQKLNYHVFFNSQLASSVRPRLLHLRRRSSHRK
jgi:hypothetical protein